MLVRILFSCFPLEPTSCQWCLKHTQLLHQCLKTLHEVQKHFISILHSTDRNNKLLNSRISSSPPCIKDRQQFQAWKDSQWNHDHLCPQRWGQAQWFFSLHFIASHLKTPIITEHLCCRGNELRTAFHARSQRTTVTLSFSLSLSIWSLQRETDMTLTETVCHLVIVSHGKTHMVTMPLILSGMLVIAHATADRHSWPMWPCSWPMWPCMQLSNSPSLLLAWFKVDISNKLTQPSGI